jgi:site-specific DNA-methyltransferase (cytosine-N4-specific)
MTHLRWHDYRYYPYERVLARREVLAVLGSGAIEESDSGLFLSAGVDREAAENLTYFSRVEGGKGVTHTTQARLEAAARSGRTRQATRYSVHGLHEYKGKFNPQVAKALLNIFGIGSSSKVLDPFCGSGTTLVECAHLGATGVGTDLNPLAVFITNAKLACLSIPIHLLQEDFDRLCKHLKRLKKPRLGAPMNARDHYLRAWFVEEQLAVIESVMVSVRSVCAERAEVFLAIASNLLRDYSDQEPGDLRIRRRSSPMPEIPFEEAFYTACNKFLERVEAAQLVLGIRGKGSSAVLGDVRKSRNRSLTGPFDAAITSPPYATALPYIDTQRLSLVWLGLCEPSEIAGLDSTLIGSREATTRHRKELQAKLDANLMKLPAEQNEFCRSLSNSIGPSDGFRRIAVPGLLYRYFSDMLDGFKSVAKHLRPHAPYALIVGHNHTVLGGTRKDINTPMHLASLAKAAGWEIEEVVPLQTYRRYGLHAVNAVETETLLILRNAGRPKSLV